MIARVAESCFWLNRYVERLGTMARLLGVNMAYVLDVDLQPSEEWLPLLIVSGEQDHFARLHGSAAVEDGELIQRFLTWEEGNPCSLLESLYRARENARTVRETISLEMWECINDLWTWMNDREARRLYDRNRQEFYDRIRRHQMCYTGICQDTMLHEDAFDFMRLGSTVERTGQTARILDVKHHRVGEDIAARETPADAAQWMATLRSCLGIEPFLKRSANVLSGRRVAAFLLFDRAFPHSVLHNLDRTVNFLALLRREAPANIGRRSIALARAAESRVAKMTIERVVETGLHAFLTSIIDDTGAISAAIEADFFQKAPEQSPRRDAG